MTTQQLTYVLAVAECRSISKAAEKLYVTQPSLSQFIHSIEKQLGVQLFDRSVTPLCLTEAGKLYAEWARRLLAMEDQMNNALADLMGLETGSVHIGASPFRVRCMLARSISAFHERWPGIRISIREADMKRLCDMLAAGELDYVIGTPDFDAKGFHVEELAAERLYLAVAQGSPIAEKLPPPLTAEDIKNFTPAFLRAEPVSPALVQDAAFVAANAGEYDREKLDTLCRACGFTPKIEYSTETIETVFAFVRAGMGVGLLPDALIYYGNFAEHPLYYMLPDEIASCSISLITRRNAVLSKAASAYALQLKQLVDIGTWRVGADALTSGGTA